MRSRAPPGGLPKDPISSAPSIDAAYACGAASLVGDRMPCDCSPVLSARLCGVALCVFLLGAPPALATPVRYAIDAALDPSARTIAGSVEIGFQNTAAVPLAEVTLLLYPNRFARAEPGIDDLNRPYVYPREQLVPGGIAIEDVEARAASAADPRFRPARDLRREPVNGWPDTLVRVRLADALAPGAAGVLRVRFRTVLPERYGPFGVSDGRVVALAGWCPMLPPLGADGTWQAGAPPPAAETRGELRAPPSSTVVLGPEIHGPGHEPAIGFALAGPACPALLASAEYRLYERELDGRAIRLAELPSRRALAFRRGRRHAELVLDAVTEIVRALPAGLVPPGTPLLVVEAPLRLELTAPAVPDVVVVSDRILRVHRLLRDFHERELAAAVYAAVLAGRVAARESAADASWVTEAVAGELADRYLAAARPRHRTVYDWIGLFDVFAIVDRFESAPKIPFERAFFPEARRADALADGVESFARDRPPGRTILTKLRNEIGADAAAAAVDRYLAGAEPLRVAAAAASGQALDWLFAQWTAPYPAVLDYAAVDAQLNLPAAGVESETAAHGGAANESSAASSESGASGGGAPPREAVAPAGVYRHRVTVARAASRPIREPVEVALEGAGARATWDDDRERAVLELRSARPARRVTLDPERRLLEDTRGDDARPRPAQVVLDSADVTVTSSEFAVSGLFVARRRYDYTRDLGLVAFFSDRSVGLHLGPRWHFGIPNDATSYRHNLFAFYTFADLRAGFQDDSRPHLRTDGVLGGLGLRYDYGDELSYDNPTVVTKLRVFGDWYDGALGSSFDYAGGGVRASVVRPLGTPRTLVAAQVLNAFTTPTASGRVPNQGRYSLGGDLAVRAVPVEERLGENIALARLELRQTVSPEIDWNLMDWLVLRRGQLRFFVDAGRVEDRRASLYRAADFAVGVGIGAAGFYDFMGFYPAVAYVAIAQRVDRVAESGVQFLFGTRQAF